MFTFNNFSPQNRKLKETISELRKKVDESEEKVSSSNLQTTARAAFHFDTSREFRSIRKIPKDPIQVEELCNESKLNIGKPWEMESQNFKIK